MDIDKAIEWEQEKAARRAAWEDERKAEAERREREEKQGRFEAWLKARGQAFLDHTGSLPPTYIMESWRADYVAERAAEQELERERRLAQAEDVAGS